MAILIVFGALALLLAAASMYLGKAKDYLGDAEPAWNRLYEATKAVIADTTMPAGAVNFAVAAVMCAGCGCLTRGILIDMVRRHGRHEVPKTPPATPEQMALMRSVVLNAVFYDALRAPVSGFILRRLAAPWLKAASEGRFAPSKSQEVNDFAASSRRSISHRPEGRRLLTSGA